MVEKYRRDSADFWHLFTTGCLTLVYVVFAAAHVMAIQEDGFRISLLLLVAFESVMVVLVFLRRPSSLTDLSVPAIVAGLIGGFAGLGLRPVGDSQDLLIGQLIMTVGIIIQLGASFSIGRSFGVVPANRGIKTDGLYRLVRHPFYMAYLFTEGGYIINNPSALNVAVMAIGTGFQILRIRYEEQLLLEDGEYADYAKNVRWHLVPGVW